MCRDVPIYRALPGFWLCIRSTLGTLIPASSTRHRRENRKLCPPIPPLLQAAFSVSQQKALPFCLCRHNLLYSSHKSHQHTPKIWKPLTISLGETEEPHQEPVSPGEKQPAHPHISYPFPRPNYSPGQQRVTCSSAQRWVQQVPHHLGAQLERARVYQSAASAGDRGAKVRGSLGCQRPRVPRGRSAISSFACTSHMTLSCFQACRWQSIYFSNPALWQGNFIVWCFCQEN